MKRDMDLVRKILLALEEHNHACLMGEAALLDVVDRTHMQSASPSAIPRRMTWEGHDFLEAAREPSRWTAALKKISASGAAMTFEILKGVLESLSEEALSR